MPKDPYRGSIATQPKQRAVVESRLRDDEETLARCPLCAGLGWVTAEVLALFERVIKAIKDTE